MYYREIMRPDKAEETYRVFNEVFRTGKPARAMDWEMIRKDGRLLTSKLPSRPFASRRSAIRDSGAWSGM